MYPRFLRSLALLPLAAAPGLASANADAWWQQLQSLCGNAYLGTETPTTRAEEGFGGQRLVLHIRECEENRVRIAFVVGEDLSRIWVVTRHEDRVELRHEHRDTDGAEQPVSGYGGYTTNPGTAITQLFPADTRTHELVPDAYPNIWNLQIEPGQRMVYAVQRMGTQREFRVEFDLTATVDEPPVPWGWDGDSP